MKFANLGDMFLKNAAIFSEKPVYMFKKDGYYQAYTYREFRDKVINLAAAFKSFGMKKGDRVAILSNNRPEWAMTDYACQVSGLVSVPIYSTLLAHQIEYILNDSGTTCLIVENKYQADKIEEIRNNLKTLKSIAVMDDDGLTSIAKLDEWLKIGEDYNSKNPDWNLPILHSVDSGDMATIIYTSGTTGNPKGVMLSHRNFLENIKGAMDVLPIVPDDLFLSFLPLSHVFERMAGHYLPYHQGATIAYAESIETVANNLQEVKPTIMTSVPRFYEKVYDKIVTSIQDGSVIKRLIFSWCLSVGKRRLKYVQNNTKLPAGLRFKYNLANKLVFQKLKEKIGGRIRFFVSGGAPLAKEIGEFFAFADIIILEGYGLTETSPVITVNQLQAYKFGSVGLPLSNVEAKIAEDGEILTRGPHVMIGYFKNEKATKEILDEDNWLHTGDIGYFDKDGFLIITDRKKNIIVTSGGKNVAPQPIENSLITSRYVEQVIIVGNKRKYCTALIVPNLDNLKSYALQNEIIFNNVPELLANPLIEDLYRLEIDKVSGDLASYETIKEFRLLEKPFTIEAGELTPSLKIKRRVVEEKYKKIIDSMYAE